MNDTAPIVSPTDRAIGSLSADRRWIAVAIVHPADAPGAARDLATVND